MNPVHIYLQTTVRQLICRRITQLRFRAQRHGTDCLKIRIDSRTPAGPLPEAPGYLAGHPLSSGFLNNFQVVGFADVGTAWTGWNPWDNENAWNTEIIQNGPMTITIDANRDPIVAGYGFGARAQLLGYFIRLDWAWGLENMKTQPRMFYLSLSLDF